MVRMFKQGGKHVDVDEHEYLEGVIANHDRPSLNIDVGVPQTNHLTCTLSLMERKKFAGSHAGSPKVFTPTSLNGFQSHNTNDDLQL